MNEEHTSPMTPLDQMLAQDSLQMLKAAVPYFPAGAQRIRSPCFPEDRQS